VHDRAPANSQAYKTKKNTGDNEGVPRVFQMTAHDMMTLWHDMTWHWQSAACSCWLGERQISPEP